MRRLLPPVVALALCAPAAAAAPEGGSWLFAKAQRPGRIDLYVFDYPGAHAAFFERIGTRRVPLGEATIPARSDIGALTGAARWRCDRRTRRFAAQVQRPGGERFDATYEIRTPPCARRYALTAPRSAPPGSLAAVGVRDTWALGDGAPRLCVRAPDGAPVCREVALGGRSSAIRHVRLRRAGRWVVELRWGRFSVGRTIAAGGAPAGPAPAVPAVVVAGDSTAQNIDTLVEERLGRRARVIRAWRGGSSLGTDGTAWLTGARRTAARFAPRATIVSVGANEGYPIATGTRRAACCGPRWTAAYADRVAKVMRAYDRAGRGRVLWLTLPVMQDPRRQVIAAAVDAAVRRAAAGDPAVTVVDLVPVISPGGRFRRYLTWHGRRLRVREPDGIHLTIAGAGVATDLIMRILRARPALLG